ncbi:hypothetical protein CY34DRAFT_809668 [Suillus luteus UH-Slu-Lm8-n1]|uniref:WD40 repeat-like protein n=1 Tax=Suillus luteus UH-Slu-Lm8-n1 TaxID=930992 RepID=A0A0D0AJ23_9AGAM|nr:hypothetical protein CY34DRAFT_809668 [Suillus luteus UH-Slu-Lm8-n1]
MSSATSTIAPRQTMQGHTGWVNGGVHLPNGRHIMTCSSDSSIRLWDLESGAQIEEDWRDPDENNVGLRSMALSPNGKIIASGSDDGKVRLWDVETTKVISKWTGHTHVVYALCWSADGERVASGSWDRTARVWDVKSGQTVLTIKTGHKLVYAVVYSPDGTKIATGGDEEKAVKIWDAKSGELLNTLKHRVCSLAWTSDGKKLISGSYRLVRIFDTATWQQTAILRGHTNFVYAISLFPNNRLLASASDDKTARLWNLDTNLPVGPPLPHEQDLPSVALSHDGKLLLTVCENKDAYIWDIHTILKEAGLEDLLSTESGQHSSRSSLSDKPFLRADATRGLGQFGDDERSPNFFNTSSPMGGAQPRSSLNAILPRISSLLGRFRPNNEVLHHSRPSGFRPLFDRLRSSIHRSTRENDIPDGPQQHSRPSGIHLNALFNRLTSLTHRTPPDNDAPDEPQQPSTSSQLDPHIDEEAQLPQHSRPSVAHLRALLSRLTSLTHRTPPDNDALDEPQQPSTSSRLDPRVLASRLFSHFPRSRLGTDAEEAEADPTTSSPRPGITDRLSSLFRSQPHMDEEIELPERPNHPRVVGAFNISVF